MSRESKGKLPGKKINPLPKVQQKRPHLPIGGGLPPAGNPWAGRNSGPSSWQPRRLQQVLAQALAGTRGGSRPSMGAQGQEAGRQGPGTRTPASLGPGRNPTVAGGLGCLFLSLSRALCKSFSWETGSPACQVQHTGSSAGLIPTHPAWP